MANLRLLTIALLLLATPALAERPPKTEAEIEYLLQKVEKSGDRFIREGKEYGGKEAAAHLRQKLSAAGNRVKTAEDFIEGIASKSYLTRKPYFIAHDGQQLPAGEYFKRWLAERRAQ